MAAKSNNAVVVSTRYTLPISGKDVIIVKINRPDCLNSFNTEVCHELANIFARYEKKRKLLPLFLRVRVPTFVLELI
jgi:enoyl-CoA hydratase/carnithine racemase